MSWRITLKFNGRLCGPREIVRDGFEDRPTDADIDAITLEATREEGRIFVVYWSVEWIDPPLEDNGPPDEGEWNNG